jgi:hypothetical protein
MSRKIVFLKVLGAMGAIPTARDLMEVRKALVEAGKDEIPTVIGSFSVNVQVVDVPEGAEIILAPDVPTKIEVRRPIIEGELVPRDEWVEAPGSAAENEDPGTPEKPKKKAKRKPTPCLDPEKMKGAEDGFGGTDFPDIQL